MSGFRADLRRSGRDARSILRIVLAVKADYGLQALAAYRLGRWLRRRAARPAWWLVLPFGWALYAVARCYTRHALGIRLDLSADIGPGLYVGHFGGIVLRRCRLGANCSISQSCRIEPDGTGAGPVLGDRVWVGAHARILGPVRIGDRSTISACAVVKRDIPDTTLCMGNPARVVLRNYDNSKVLNLPPDPAGAA